MQESDEYSSLTDLIFDKDSLESADFEIAFTATLATIVLTSIPSPDVPATALKLISISLIAITLVRRMAVSSRFADERQILSATMVPIEFLTILTLFHLFYTPAQFISRVIPTSQSALLVAALLIPELILLLIVIQEILFKNYMIWWGGFALGQAGNTTNPAIRALGGFVALFAFQASLVEDLPDNLYEAQEFVTNVETKLQEALSRTNQQVEGITIPISGKTAIATWKVIVFFLSAFALLSIILILAFVLSILFGSVFQILLLFFSVFFIRHIVRFYYLAYGLPEEGQMFNKGLPVILITYSVYVLGLYFVFVRL